MIPLASSGSGAADYRAERESITQIRLSENREIGVLNDRHADYISEVRFLQAVQRKLRLRLEQWMKAGKPRKREDMTEICLAKGRGKVIQEECARLRKENQKIMDDIASQRQIFDRETQERYSYERRAVPLLQECEELLKSYKGVQVPVPRYSTEDIERDRKQFRAEVEASMGDIRRQYEIVSEFEI
ncbi:unnamed protein product [Cylicostephanus goldi]|uniref:IF rod domain-containing protein n=1 Tax=Cylicostephanus goldi TaxID=71465 RepID=A0A3P7MV42_CYLGO|nr:unnamed protein product [Cylicostephanus goldi]